MLEPDDAKKTVSRGYDAFFNSALSAPNNPNPGHNFGRVFAFPSARGIIQRKLTIGESDDIYEQEADRVADRVMRMPEPVIQRKPG